MIVRALTEWTSTNQTNTMDQVSIAEGIGGFTFGSDGGGTGAFKGPVNVRQNYIQGIDLSVGTSTALIGTGVGPVPNAVSSFNGNFNGAGSTYCTRRYQVNLALGLLTQDKLLPVKFMASQLAIEITLEQPAACIFANPGAATGTGPTYAVGNVNLIPEILEFDSSYDAMFLKGLQDGGVPIKFSSWHTFVFSTANSSAVNLLISERSRSVKALFAMQRRSPYLMTTDSGATFFDTSTYAAGGNTMQSYQWRIGGRYFPAQPVQTSLALGNPVSNKGCEAFVELQKALNVVGDYRLSTSVNTNRWAMPAASAAITVTGGQPTSLAELDYAESFSKYGANGAPVYQQVTVLAASATGNSFAGNQGSECFASAIDLETSNGVEISGLNAEEQSDISFIANWQTAQNGGAGGTFTPNLEVYSYYDAMIILRENNVLELIQ